MSSNFNKVNGVISSTPSRGKNSASTSNNSFNPFDWDTPECGVHTAERRKAHHAAKVDETAAATATAAAASDSEKSETSSESNSDGTHDSSSSSSSSDLEPAVEKEQQKTKKHKKKKSSKTKRRKDFASSGITGPLKVPTPLIYDGTADHYVFEQWAFTVKIWKRMNGLDDEWAVLLLYSYITGRAMAFFMSYVAPNPKKWKLDAVFKGIFDYCFPLDFESRLKKALMNSKQGTKRFKFFAHEVQSVAERYGVMMSWDVNKALWDGAAPYVRNGWIEAGCRRESTPVEILVDVASRYETAETLTRVEQEGVRFVSPNRGDWDPDQPATRSRDKHDHDGAGRSQPETGGGGSRTSDWEWDTPRRKPRKEKHSRYELEIRI